MRGMEDLTVIHDKTGAAVAVALGLVPLRDAPLQRRRDRARRHARPRRVVARQRMVAGRRRLSGIPGRQRSARLRLQRARPGRSLDRAAPLVRDDPLAPVPAAAAVEAARSAQPAPARARLLQHAERRRREARRPRRRDPPKSSRASASRSTCRAAPRERDFVGAVHDEIVSLEGEFAPAGQHVFGRNLRRRPPRHVPRVPRIRRRRHPPAGRQLLRARLRRLARNPDAATPTARSITTSSTRSAKRRAR
jgi:hypothetical protein